MEFDACVRPDDPTQSARMSGLSPPNQSDAPPDGDARAQFDRLLGDLRPRLHRYCARMTGSIIDGEDVVQDALIKAIEAFAQARPIANVEGWLFRIAHNAALDFLRKRARQQAMRSEEDLDMVGDPVSAVSERQAAAASLRTFMRLPAAQRSSVILMDVLGYSLDEVGGIIDTSVPAVKAHLHRGRERLRALAQEPDDLPAPILAEAERAPRRLCRAFQCARLRCRARHARRRRAPGTRQQDSDEGQGRGFRIFRKLFEDRRLAPGAGAGGRPSRHPGVRSEPAGGCAEISHAVAVVCRQGRRDPRLPSRGLCHRWRRISGLTAISRTDMNEIAKRSN
jgi:RNA polymerase sigma factor (sigma-70 family)